MVLCQSRPAARPTPTPGTTSGGCRPLAQSVRDLSPCTSCARTLPCAFAQRRWHHVPNCSRSNGPGYSGPSRAGVSSDSANAAPWIERPCHASSPACPDTYRSVTPPYALQVWRYTDCPGQDAAPTQDRRSARGHRADGAPRLRVGHPDDSRDSELAPSWRLLIEVNEDMGKNAAAPFPTGTQAHNYSRDTLHQRSQSSVPARRRRTTRIPPVAVSRRNRTRSRERALFSLRVRHA